SDHARRGVGPAAGGHRAWGADQPGPTRAPSDRIPERLARVRLRECPYSMVAVIHAACGFGILVLLPWKSIIGRRGLGRPRPGRWASVLLGVLVLISLAAGLLHSTGLLVYWGPLTAMELHVGSAIAAVPFAIWHVAARRVRVRPTDLSRRSVLVAGAVVAGAAMSYGASEGVGRATAMPGAARRFTGSYEAGSYQPSQMPVSSWMFDSVPQINQQAWKLTAGGREWSYDELSAFDDRLTATLDCTGASSQPRSGPAPGWIA